MAHNQTTHEYETCKRHPDAQQIRSFRYFANQGACLSTKRACVHTLKKKLIIDCSLGSAARSKAPGF
jgi:hypothetical protein